MAKVRKPLSKHQVDLQPVDGVYADSAAMQADQGNHLQGFIYTDGKTHYRYTGLSTGVLLTDYIPIASSDLDAMYIPASAFTVIKFDRLGGYVIGTPEDPVTSPQLSFDFTDSTEFSATLIHHQGAEVPTFDGLDTPNNTKILGEYITSAVNKILIVHERATNVTIGYLNTDTAIQDGLVKVGEIEVTAPEEAEVRGFEYRIDGVLFSTGTVSGIEIEPTPSNYTRNDIFVGKFNSLTPSGGTGVVEYIPGIESEDETVLPVIPPDAVLLGTLIRKPDSDTVVYPEPDLTDYVRKSVGGNQIIQSLLTLPSIKSPDIPRPVSVNNQGTLGVGRSDGLNTYKAEGIEDEWNKVVSVDLTGSHETTFGFVFTSMNEEGQLVYLNANGYVQTTSGSISEYDFRYSGLLLGSRIKGVVVGDELEIYVSTPRTSTRNWKPTITSFQPRSTYYELPESLAALPAGIQYNFSHHTSPILISIDPPAGHNDDGTLWLNPEEWTLCVFYDGTWAEIGGGASTIAADWVTVSLLPPTNPQPGRIWIDSESLDPFVWFDNYWVQFGGGSAGTPGGAASIVSISHQDLTALRLASNLIPGQLYRVSNFTTVHRLQNPNTIITGPTEQILVVATSVNGLARNCRSYLYPQDELEIDWTSTLAEDGTTVRGGWITYRHDKVKNVSAFFDFRHVKVRRWLFNGFDHEMGFTSPSSGNVTLTLTWSPNMNASYLNQYRKWEVRFPSGFTHAAGTINLTITKGAVSHTKPLVRKTTMLSDWTANELAGKFGPIIYSPEANAYILMDIYDVGANAVGMNIARANTAYSVGNGLRILPGSTYADMPTFNVYDSGTVYNVHLGANCNNNLFLNDVFNFELGGASHNNTFVGSIGTAKMGGESINNLLLGNLNWSETSEEFQNNVIGWTAAYFHIEAFSINNTMLPGGFNFNGEGTYFWNNTIYCTAWGYRFHGNTFENSFLALTGSNRSDISFDKEVNASIIGYFNGDGLSFRGALNSKYIHIKPTVTDLFDSINIGILPEPVGTVEILGRDSLGNVVITEVESGGGGEVPDPLEEGFSISIEDNKINFGTQLSATPSIVKAPLYEKDLVILGDYTPTGEITKGVAFRKATNILEVLIGEHQLTAGKRFGFFTQVNSSTSAKTISSGIVESTVARADVEMTFASSTYTTRLRAGGHANYNAQVIAVALSNNSSLTLSRLRNNLTQSIVFNTSGAMVVTDAINSKGLEYAGNYEANFTARSLITKQHLEAYVDDAIAGIEFPEPVGYVESITGTGLDLTDPNNPVLTLSSVAVSGDYNDLINKPVFSGVKALWSYRLPESVQGWNYNGDLLHILKYTFGTNLRVGYNGQNQLNNFQGITFTDLASTDNWPLITARIVEIDTTQVNSILSRTIYATEKLIIDGVEYIADTSSWTGLAFTANWELFHKFRVTRSLTTQIPEYVHANTLTHYYIAFDVLDEDDNIVESIKYSVNDILREIQATHGNTAISNMGINVNMIFSGEDYESISDHVRFKVDLDFYLNSGVLVKSIRAPRYNLSIYKYYFGIEPEPRFLNISVGTGNTSDTFVGRHNPGSKCLIHGYQVSNGFYV